MRLHKVTNALVNKEQRKSFVDKLIKVWGNDESGANDSSAAVD